MNSPIHLNATVDSTDLERLVTGQHHDPHHVLGAHPERDAAGRERVVIRGWRPAAVGMVDPRRWATGGNEPRASGRCVRRGVAGSGHPGLPPGDDLSRRSRGRLDDPYRFWPTLGELDLHLLAEGRHEGLWHHLGAQVRVHQGTSGTSFAVWAPGARAVRVVGDFNGWDGRIHPMRALGSSGVWEIFLPDVGAGAHYKYEVRHPAGPAEPAGGPVRVRRRGAAGHGQHRHPQQLRMARRSSGSPTGRAPT